MILQKTKVKKLFNDSGIQVSPDAMDLINADIERRLHTMVKNVKWCNVKRLKADSIWALYKKVN